MKGREEIREGRRALQQYCEVEDLSKRKEEKKGRKKKEVKKKGKKEKKRKEGGQTQKIPEHSVMIFWARERNKDNQRS